MPQITAFGKVFRDWEGLIGACLRNLATREHGVAPCMTFP